MNKEINNQFEIFVEENKNYNWNLEEEIGTIKYESDELNKENICEIDSSKFQNKAISTMVIKKGDNEQKDIIFIEPRCEKVISVSVVNAELDEGIIKEKYSYQMEYVFVLVLLKSGTRRH